MLNAKDLFAKFTRLDFQTSKKRLVAEEKPEAPSEVEIEDAAIEQLGRYTECSDLLSLLNRELEILEVDMGDAIGDTPKMCVIQGQKQAFRSIITKLEGKEK